MVLFAFLINKATNVPTTSEQFHIQQNILFK